MERCEHRRQPHPYKPNELMPCAAPDCRAGLPGDANLELISEPAVEGGWSISKPPEVSSRPVLTTDSFRRLLTNVGWFWVKDK